MREQSKSRKRDYQSTLFPSKPKNYLKEHRNIIIASAVLFLLVVIMIILSAPLFDVQTLETKTRTVEFPYTSEVYDQNGNIWNISVVDSKGYILYYPSFVTVTNLGAKAGSFVITLKNEPINRYTSNFHDIREGENTQTANIQAGATQRFNLPAIWTPDGWIDNVMGFSYTITPPTMQEKYNITVNDKKSLLEIVFGF